MRALCAQQVPATPSATSRCRADYSDQTFKHILAPVWLLSYTYGARAFQCAMNGVTGAVRGEYPKSPWKVALLVLAILVVVVIAFSLAEGIDGRRGAEADARAAQTGVLTEE